MFYLIFAKYLLLLLLLLLLQKNKTLKKVGCNNWYMVWFQQSNNYNPQKVTETMMLKFIWSYS